MIIREVVVAYAQAMDEYLAGQINTEQGHGGIISCGGRNDTVVNYTNGMQISTGGGNDSITSIAGGVVIDSGDDDDSIIAIGMGTDISAGAGDDQIYSQYSNVNIDKGTGADKVYVTGKFNITGLDNAQDDVADIIMTPGYSFQYVKGQGLLLDKIYLDEEPECEEDDESEDESEVIVNIYN
ncbi:hypothetical protein IJE86_06170 [bacterium]|nr:hypothetical protein [bacterium]